jgi:hypothetical protein
LPASPPPPRYIPVPASLLYTSTWQKGDSCTSDPDRSAKSGIPVPGSNVIPRLAGPGRNAIPRLAVPGRNVIPRLLVLAEMLSPRLPVPCRASSSLLQVFLAEFSYPGHSVPGISVLTWHSCSYQECSGPTFLFLAGGPPVPGRNVFPPPLEFLFLAGVPFLYLALTA